MERFVICGETFELDGAAAERGKELLAEFKRDSDELLSKEWTHTPGILDEPGFLDAVKRRLRRLHEDFESLARAFGAAR